jgi:hypothetical protein
MATGPPPKRPDNQARPTNLKALVPFATFRPGVLCQPVAEKLHRYLPGDVSDTPRSALARRLVDPRDDVAAWRGFSAVKRLFPPWRVFSPNFNIYIIMYLCCHCRDAPKRHAKLDKLVLEVMLWLTNLEHNDLCLYKATDHLSENILHESLLRTLNGQA